MINPNFQYKDPDRVTDTHQPVFFGMLADNGDKIYTGDIVEVTFAAIDPNGYWGPDQSTFLIKWSIKKFAFVAFCLTESCAYQKGKEYPLHDLIGETEIVRLGDIKNNPEMLT